MGLKIGINTLSRLLSKNKWCPNLGQKPFVSRDEGGSRQWYHHFKDFINNPVLLLQSWGDSVFVLCPSPRVKQRNHHLAMTTITRNSTSHIYQSNLICIGLTQWWTTLLQAPCSIKCWPCGELNKRRQDHRYPGSLKRTYSSVSISLS